MGKRGPKPGFKNATPPTEGGQPGIDPQPSPDATPSATPPANPNLYRPVDGATPAAGGKTRASFAVTEDGLIDTKGMRDENLSRLRELLRDPRNQSALGLVRPDEPLILISEAEVSQLYDMIATVEITLAPLMRIHPEAARRTLPFSKEEKEKLTPATQAVVSKHAPDVLLKWKDEFMLAAMLLAITRAKMTAAQAMTKQIVEEMQRRAEAEKEGRPQ